MNYQTITREDLIDKLHVLQKEYDDLKALYTKDVLEVQNREAQYRTILNASPDDVTITDLQGQILMVSDAALRLFKIARQEDVLGRSMTEYLDPGDRERAMFNFLNLFQGIGAEPTEYRGMRTDGSTFDVEVNGAFVRDTKDNPVNVVFVVRDITERKNAEKALKQSQVLLKSSIESQKDTFFFSIDRNYNYLLFNEVHANLMKTHNDADIKLGESFLDCINSEENKKSAKTDYDRVLKGESFSDIRVFGDAEPVYYEGFFNPIINEKNEVIGATTLGRNITERKKAEAAVFESEANLNAMFNITDESIFLLNTDETLLGLNKIAATRLGCSREEIIGHNLSEVLPPDVEAYRRPFLDRALNADEKVSFEDARDGRWMINNIYPIHNEEGVVARLAVYSRDITERKQREEEIKQKNSELYLLNAEKDKFLSILAHDLRSPFSSLLGFTKMMEDELPRMSREQILKIAGSMRRSATNLYRLLENLLEWSGLQRGMITYNPSSFLLKPWLSENMALAEESARNKDINIRYEIPIDLEVFADARMLGGLIRNLSSNAVKFTPKRGNVSVTAKLLPNKWVEISVKDSGIGISKEMISDIFRLDIDTRRKGTDKEPSTGLGLIICKEFIEKHKGKLWVESEVGKGSTFYFTLPNKEDQ